MRFVAGTLEVLSRQDNRGRRVRCYTEPQKPDDLTTMIGSDASREIRAREHFGPPGKIEGLAFEPLAHRIHTRELHFPRKTKPSSSLPKLEGFGDLVEWVCRPS